MSEFYFEPAEFGDSAARAIKRLQSDCYWSSGSYPDVIMNVSKYLEHELALPDASRFMHELLMQGDLPDETLFEISPREALEQVRLLPIMKMSDYQARLLDADDYEEWFSAAVSLAMSYDSDYHRTGKDACLGLGNYENCSCANSSHCPLRSVRFLVMDHVAPFQNNSLIEGISAPPLPVETIDTELNAVGARGIIPVNMIPGLLNTYRRRIAAA
jgi:hypothetical protein